MIPACCIIYLIESGLGHFARFSISLKISLRWFRILIDLGYFDCLTFFLWSVKNRGCGKVGSNICEPTWVGGGSWLVAPDRTILKTRTERSGPIGKNGNSDDPPKFTIKPGLHYLCNSLNVSNKTAILLFLDDLRLKLKTYFHLELTSLI